LRVNDIPNPVPSAYTPGNPEVGHPYTYAMPDAACVDTDEVTFTEALTFEFIDLEIKVSWLTIDLSTGDISGTPVYTGAPTSNIKIRCTD